MNLVWKFKWGRMNSQGGYVLIMSVFVILIMAIIGISLVVVGTSEFGLSSRTQLLKRAYEIAEAGVNRAVAQSRVDSSIATLSDSQGHVYGDPNAEGPQWRVQEAFGEGSGQYTVEMWQQRSDPGKVIDPVYKVIVSTGNISNATGKVTRTIEARVMLDAANGQYDAAFDYCMYNGDTSGLPDGQWPDNTHNFWVGTFDWDGQSAYTGPGTNMQGEPRGAIYANGSIKLSPRVGARLGIKGNMIATRNIDLTNTANGAGGIKIEGNCVAGASADWESTSANRGNATLTTVADPGYTPSLEVTGGLAASGDVNIVANASLNFGTTPLKIGHITAGEDVTVSGTANISGSMRIGETVCGGHLTGNLIFGGGVIFGNIWAGNGVEIQTHLAADRIGDVETPRAVNLNANPTGFWEWFGGITTGNIIAGSDGAGMGVNFGGSRLAGINTGNISGQGYVKAYGSTGSVMETGSISSNGSVIFIAGGDFPILSDNFLIKGPITANGYVDLQGKDAIEVRGDIQSKQWIRVYGPASGLGAMDLKGNVLASNLVIPVSDDTPASGQGAGNSVYVENKRWNTNNINGNVKAVGPIYLRGACRPFNIYGSVMSSSGSVYYERSGQGWISTGDANITGGLWGNGVSLQNTGGFWWTDTDLTVGKLPNDGWGNNDAIRSNGYVNLTAPDNFGDAGDIHVNGNTRYNPAGGYNPDGDIRYSGGGAIGDFLWSAPTIWPSFPDPATVPRTPVLGAGKDVDIFGEANLASPVDLPVPNWGYFSRAAASDNASNPTGPDHILDAHGGSNVHFTWDVDAQHPYSDNETVYCGDTKPNSNDFVDLYIDKLNLATGPQDVIYTATIVSRGNVYIDARTSTDDFTVNQNCVLNIIAGGDIILNTNPAEDWNPVDNANEHFHWYAGGIIDISNAKFSATGETDFFGTLTAGKYIKFTSNRAFDKIVWRFSRFGLDTEAWIPPFQFLSWREIQKPAATH